MIGSFNNIKIQGMATAVPSIVEENMDYVGILGERRTKKQIKLTGVSKRHISETEQRTSDLCYAAAVQLLDKLKWNRDEIKVFVYITQGPNYEVPSTAFFLQQRLGFSKDCVLFDLNLGCSSFNVGVHVVSALMQSCSASDKAVLLLGDTSGKVLCPDEKLDEEVVANRMLFGSAGAAVALEKVEKSDLKFMTRSDGTRYEAIIQHKDCTVTMDGTAVFEFAINDVSDDVKAFKQHFGICEEEIDYYVFHQAQKLILDNIAMVCEIPEGKELRSLEEYGNTSGTSVPLTVCANRDKFAGRDSVKLFLCGFGVGLSWGSIFAEIPTENILPVIETDEHFDEDKRPAKGLEDKKILVVGSDLPIGESLSRYISKKSAEVILMGREQDKLRQIKEDLFIKSYVVSCDKSGDDMVDRIAGRCAEEGWKLDGVLFAEADQEAVREVLTGLKDKECMSESVSVVILSDLETSKGTDCQKYLKEKAELDVFVASLQDQVLSEGERVNAVLYDAGKLNLTQITGNGQQWIEQFLKQGCPPEMKRPLYIGEAVKYLLSDKSIYTAGTLISVRL